MNKNEKQTWNGHWLSMDESIAAELTTAAQQNVLDKNGNVTVWITAFLKWATSDYQINVSRQVD